MRARPPRRSASLAAVTELLGLQPWPPPALDPSSATRLGLVGGRSGPRFLVPTGFPEAAPEACLAYLGLRDPRTRLARGAVGWALRAGITRPIVRHELAADTGPGSLLAHLEHVLHDPDEPAGLAVAVGLGPVDPVWKPTLQVFRPDGEPAAFVKIGLGPVAAALVTNEIDVLRTWERAPDPRLVVPRLIAETSWRGLPMAVIGPLPPDARRLPHGPTSAWAVRDLDGPVVTHGLAAGAWWNDRRVGWARHTRVHQLLGRIEDRHARTVDLAWGRWHGDWVPWNLGRCHRGLAAWDWEHSEPGAPVGLDEVHAAYQQARVVGGQSIAASFGAARRAALRHTENPPAWLADAHVAMVVTRSAKVGRLRGRPTPELDELLDAAAGAVVANGALGR